MAAGWAALTSDAPAAVRGNPRAGYTVECRSVLPASPIGATAMPVTWKIEDEVLTVAVIENYTLTDVQRAVEAALADPAFRRGSTLLVDTRAAITYMTDDEVQRRAEWFASLIDRGVRRQAFLSPAAPHRIRRMELVVGYLNTLAMDACAFTDLETALRWLRAP
jgi:hypothetical protein